MTKQLDPQVKAAVSIEPLAIEEEFIRLPGDLAYWNERYSDVYQQHLELDVEVDALAARLFMDAKATLPGGTRGPTVSDIENTVTANSELIALKMKQAIVHAEKIRLFGIVDAIRSKKEMLISLGAHIRQERGNDPGILERTRLDQATSRGNRAMDR